MNYSFCAVLRAVLVSVFSTILFSTTLNAQSKFIPSEAFVDIAEANNAGAFKHSVSIDLPEYRGLVPNIGLSYSSSWRKSYGVDSLMGPGWRISGLSRIELVSIGGGIPTWSAEEDMFRLDGMDLMACSDSAATNVWSGGDCCINPVWTEVGLNQCRQRTIYRPRTYRARKM